jgi:hypothetical protein
MAGPREPTDPRGVSVQARPLAIIKGVVSYLPGGLKLATNRWGGTDSVRYCYSVWMRHFVRAALLGKDRFQSVAELGPGDSLGIGLAAMLTGADSYCALDIKAYAQSAQNLKIFDQLVRLLQREEPIPGASEYPAMWPPLTSYEFPRQILTPARLVECLQPDRLDAIRRALGGDANSPVRVAYAAPWDQTVNIRRESIDFAFSQAVLEHVDDVGGTYRALASWLKPGALMSHTIDFKSHGLTRDWNGHWTVGERTWKILRGKGRCLINRMPHSAHTAEMQRNGLEIVNEHRRVESPLARRRLAREFRWLTDEDLGTPGVFIQARKRLGSDARP